MQHGMFSKGSGTKEHSGGLRCMVVENSRIRRPIALITELATQQTPISPGEIQQLRRKDDKPDRSLASPSPYRLQGSLFVFVLVSLLIVSD